MIPTFSTSTYIKIALILALCGSGAFIKYQSVKIDTLNKDISILNGEKAIYEATNKKLADNIKTQNIELKQAEDKFISYQKKLDIANIANSTLNKESLKLKEELKNKPLASDCESSIIELKSVISGAANKWNNQ